MSNTTVTNRLINEKSPYLLQHAHNPVDWYPWCDEAFAKAKKENKPVFLSIGYSTCHWCHVMAHESFEDAEIARIMNEYFVSVKVDREERPDLDQIYMDVCQALTGHGGWPLTILMTPEQQPFYAGTYFPKHSQERLIGLTDLLTVIHNKWEQEKQSIIHSAKEITDAVRDSYNQYKQEKMADFVLEKAFNTLEMAFDRKYGGFGSAPKFPSPHNLYFLLRYGIYNKAVKASDMVEKTLIQMYKGGIFDHVGFGFSRYSVDAKWLVPHFEKMLYDNALLSIVYAEAYVHTKKEIYQEIAEKTIYFVLSELKSPQGGFYTAIDADSEGAEGKFYIWTKKEIDDLLSKKEADFICAYYGITEEGNFEGQNILNLIAHADINYSEQAEQIRKKLYDERAKRVKPHRDEKILTSLNGLMIATLCIAGKAFNRHEYIETAEEAYRFINEHLITQENRILSRYCGGEAKYLGYLSDYAYFIWGLIELFLATGKEEYIEKAMDFNTRTLDLFEDEKNGGFFFTGKDSDEPIMKTKEIYDGAIPSSNSVMAMNLLRLLEITDEVRLERLAGKQFDYFAAKINESPNAYTFMLSAYMLKQQPHTKIVLVASDECKELQRITNKVNSKFMPFTTTVTLFKETIHDSGFFDEYGTFTTPVACYICESYECSDPLFSLEEILKDIDRLS